MKILVACEFSGIVRDAFTARGHYAVSCDLLPSERPGPHYEGDVRDLTGEAWDMIVAFPPCTDLSIVGTMHWRRKQEDGSQLRAARLVSDIFDCGVERVAIENPVGWLNSNWRKPDQIINPYLFGEPWKKRTCLWLKGLPELEPTKHVEPLGHWIDGGSSGNRARATRVMEGSYHGAPGPVNNETRRVSRSRTFQGIADAMAEQWGKA